MGELVNSTWQQVDDFVNTDGLKRGINTFDVFSIDDLTFPLASGRYVFKNDFTISVPITTEVGSTVYIIPDGGGRTITLDGTGDLITGNATFGILVVENINLNITGAGSTLVNTTGMLMSFDATNMLFTASAGQSIGSMINSPLSVSMTDCVINDYTNGVSVDNQATRTIIDRCSFQSDKTGTGPSITIGATCPRSESFESSFDIGDNESIFKIDSAFTGQAVIQNYTKFNANSSSYDATGLDNTSIYVRNDQSRHIGSWHVTNNAVVTTISVQGDWYDLNLGTLGVASSNIERFTFDDSTTGQLTYIGLEEFAGDLFASIGAFSSGGAQIFEFRAIKNGSPLSDNIISPRETGATVGSQSLLTPITCVTGDIIKVQVRNSEGTSNITIKDMSVTVR